MNSAFTYSYDNTFHVLIQTDQFGQTVNTMHLPKEDLQKIAFLSWYLDIDRQNLNDFGQTDDILIT